MMVRFKKQKISDQAEQIAIILLQARESKNISLEQAARHLQINIKYLRALENAEFNKLPPGVYGKNFLREYAIYLDLDPGDLKNQLEPLATKPIAKKGDPFSRKIPDFHYFLTIPKLIKNTLIVIIALICLLYLGVSVKNIIAPPNINIIYPLNDITIATNFITVEGWAEGETEIIINDEQVLLDSDGFFKKDINLKTGLNIVIITGQKRYSRETKIIRNIIVREENN